MNEILSDIAKTFSNLENGDKLIKLVKEALKKKIPAMEIIDKGLREGLSEVGNKYEAGEYFLSELLYGASLMEDAMKILSIHIQGEDTQSKKKGRIVLGTVRGDIHDIGKNIFKIIAEGVGFEVIDLGVDKDPEEFVKMVEEKKPDVLGLSSLLSTTVPEMKIVIENLKKAGMKDKVKVILGGNAVTKDYGEEIGADAVALSAVEGVNICTRWMT